MKLLISTFLLLITTSVFAAQECPDVLKHMKRKLNSQETVNFCEEYAGKTVLVVNTASMCGFTPQFKDLEKLYENFKQEGLVVMGFPSNDFEQEYSDESKTAEKCELEYGVSFPMFEPLSVRGENADPLYRQLEKQTGKSPKWNFNKYLVDKKGVVVGYYGSRVTPDNADFMKDLTKALSEE
ncbi:glutathione peroxidase [Glaciecola sp. 1036]|uniref:glutathione peroxidase n=1 Tax=Alteromonadaceae TaxID=72275 RepID=UPI003D026268